MAVISSPLGPGSISGTIENSNRSADIPIILRTTNQGTVDMTLSSTDGSFSFSDLAYGIYEVFAEIPGKSIVPQTIILDEVHPSAEGIHMMITESEIVFLGIAESEIFETIPFIYPNPANGIGTPSRGMESLDFLPKFDYLWVNNQTAFPTFNFRAMKKYILSFIVSSCVLISGVIFAQGTDWGDASDPPFPTLAVNNGASHVIVPGFHLGFTVDAETDGQPYSGMASGDDLMNFDDADGVIFNSWLVPGQQASVIVIASAAGLLDAWIDFNGNGSWSDAGDQIFGTFSLAPGYNYLNFNVPQSAPYGLWVFARFRFSSIGNLSFTGLVVDGEVEDYAVVIGAPQTGQVYIDPDPAQVQTQNEISLALVPGALFGPPSLLVAAYNDEPFAGGTGIGISYSIDAGITWANTHIQYPINPFTNTPMQEMFDPSITTDDSGHVFVSYIATAGSPFAGPVSGLFVSKSIDGGASWSVPDTVAIDTNATGNPDTAYRFNDRDQITADKYPGSPYYNRIYVTWIKDRGFNQPFQPWGDIWFSYSSDGGNHFSTARRINSWVNDMGNMPVVDVARNGKIYVLWMNYNVQTGGKGTLFLDSSTDGGVNWSTDHVIDTIDLPPLYLNPCGTLAKGAAVLRVQPADPNELYVVYAADPDAAGPEEADIFFIKSSDGGNNWTTPYRINDDTTKNDQVLPWMTVKPNGIIDIAWYDRRNDALDRMWDVYSTTSSDRGASFAQNMQVNVFSFMTPATIKFGNWFGEYLGLAADYQNAYIVHTSSNYGPLGDVEFVTAPNPDPWKDYGDAPDPLYMTRAYNLGASHVLDGLTYIGTIVDAEPDGIPDPLALGDDNYNQSDEDGVSFPAVLYAGLSDTIIVTASLQGYLNAFIDFNIDGDWADTWEQVFTDVLLNPGTNKLLLAIPANALTDTTYGRFRFSSFTGLSYNGEASDGEVEDHLLIIQAQTGIKDFPRLWPYDLKVNPTPVSDHAIFTFTLPEEGKAGFRIYDLFGKVILELREEFATRGLNERVWTRGSKSGYYLGSGIYLLELQFNGKPAAREKLMVLSE